MVSQAAQLRKITRSSVVDCGFYSLMVGIGETYLPAFLVATGSGDIAAGLITTVPMLLGSFLQLLFLKTSLRKLSYKVWVLSCATMQAAVLFALSTFPYFEHINLATIFLLATVYWASGLAAGPAWNAWMDGLVPAGERQRFLTNRSKIGQLSVFIGFFSGAAILEAGKGWQSPLLAYALIFSLGGIFRVVSTHMLSRHPGTDEHLKREILGFRNFFKTLKHESYGTFLIYLACFYFAVYVAAPFFTPFMLSKLELGYFEYGLLIAFSYIGKIISAWVIGYYCVRTSADKLLYACGLLIIPISPLWAVSQDFAFLAILQVIGGVLWGGFELATAILVFQKISGARRSSVLAHLGFIQTLSMVIGSLVGSSILDFWQRSFEAYMILFVVSGILRALCIIPLNKVTVSPVSIRALAFRTLGVRPVGGTVAKALLDDTDTEPQPSPQNKGA